MSLQGKRVAVLVEQQYQEMEVWYPVFRLREAGCAVELVGPEAGKTYASKLGYPAKATPSASECTLAALQPDELDDIPGAVTRSVEASLQRLGVERVDVLQLHNRVAAQRAPRPDVGVEVGMHPPVERAAGGVGAGVGHRPGLQRRRSSSAARGAK